MSADWTQQGGKGHTEGCPEQLTVRRSSPWHWTGHGRNGSHRTDGGHRRAVAELSVCAGRASERARELGRGRKSERGGGRAGRGAQKGAGLLVSIELSTRDRAAPPRSCPAPDRWIPGIRLRSNGLGLISADLILALRSGSGHSPPHLRPCLWAWPVSPPWLTGALALLVSRARAI